MAKRVDREYAIVLNADDVVPGYLYDKATFKYYPRTDGKQIETVSCPPTFHIDILNFKEIDNLMNVTHNIKSTWQEDIILEKSENVILVRGSKILEKMGIDPPLDKYMHTVTSVLFKSSQDMLIFFSQKLIDGFLGELKAYLNGVLCEEKESFIPQEIRKHFKKAYIYQTYSQPGSMVNYSKHAFEQFCQALKTSKISTIPLQAVIEKPKLNLPEAVRDTESMITVPPDNGTQNNLLNKSSIISKCAEEKSNLNISNQSHDSGLESISTEGMEYGSRNFSRGTGSVEHCHTGQTGSKSGRGRGLGTRMGRGKPSAADILAVGRRAQKSCNENIESSPSLHTYGSGNHGTRDFPSKCSHQGSQNNQIQTLQHQVNVSGVQEPDKAFEAFENHTMVDHNVKQLQYPSDVEKDIQPQGSFQSSSSLLSSNLRMNAQLPSHVTSANTTFLSQEKSLGVHKTYKNQAEKFSCKKGHLAVSSSHLEILNKENTEELEKHKCKAGNQSLQEIDELLEQNLREMSSSGECSDKGYTALEKKAQTKGNKSKVDKSTQIVQEIEHGKVIKLKSHTENGTKTEHGVGQEFHMQNHLELDQESSIQNVGDSYFCESNFALKSLCINSDTWLHNEAELKSNAEKDNIKNVEYEMKAEIGKDNSKNTKNSEESTSSYSSTVTQKNHARNELGIVKAKQKKQFEDIVNDDELVDSKSTKKVNHTEQNQRSEENTNMKTTLLSPVKIVRDACGMERKYFGIVNETVPEKVLILLGASGSGKTTLLNFIANYFHGNKNADDELIHVENTCQTSAITFYTFCSSVDDIPITIIDTPGLNDSSGGEVRDHVLSLKTFLANAASKNLAVHALGFVAQAHLVRLTSSERLVMDYVSTMFGQNVSEHLITLVTFADSQDIPPVIEAMKNYKVNFKQFLKFNNSSLNSGKADEVNDLDKVYYRVCWRNWKRCLKTLNDSSPLSVSAMKAVQSEVYSKTVTESAEKDIKAEISAFFCTYNREKILSRENLQVCEEIWNLAAVVQRLKSAQMSSSTTIEDILVQYAEETSNLLQISPESIVHTLALAPSKALTVAGIEIIQSMSHAHGIMKDSKPLNCLINISHCLGCNDKKEHKMARIELNRAKQAVVGSDLICFKCEDCKCPANVHGKQPTPPAQQANKILHLTVRRLRKALQSYSFPGFSIPEELFLNHLKEQMSFENQDFLNDLVTMMLQ